MAGSPAPLPRYDFPAVWPQGPHNNGLQDTVCLDALRQLFERRLVKISAGLELAPLQLFQRKVAQTLWAGTRRLSLIGPFRAWRFSRGPGGVRRGRPQKKIQVFSQLAALPFYAQSLLPAQRLFPNKPGPV